MGFRNLQETVVSLERSGQLRRVEVEVDPFLEVGAIQRRVYAAGGPALLFTRVKGCAFPMLGNLFGTLERSRDLFRDSLPAIARLVGLKADPGAAFRDMSASLGLSRHALAFVAQISHTQALYCSKPPLLHNCLSWFPGLMMAAPLLPCRRSIPNCQANLAGEAPTSACTACRFPGENMLLMRPDCITRFIGALEYIIRRP